MNFLHFVLRVTLALLVIGIAGGAIAYVAIKTIDWILGKLFDAGSGGR